MIQRFGPVAQVFTQTAKPPALRFGQTQQTSSAGQSTPQKLPRAQSKVAIIGAGNVGSSLANFLVQGELCNEVALVDINKNVATGKALDITQATPSTGSNTKINAGDDYSLIDGADIVVVTAGAARKPGMSRDDLLELGTKVVSGVSQKIKQHAPDSVIIMVSNPLDVMTHVAQKVTGFPPNRVIGMAGVLDTARLKTFIADKLQTSVQNVDTVVLGEHGDSMVPVTSQTRVSGVPLKKLLDPQTIKDLVERTRNGGAEIGKYLGTGSFVAPGASIARMVKAILNNEHQTVPASAKLNGEYGFSGVYAGVPVKLGRDGVEQVVQIDLDPDETAAFQASVKKIQDNVAKLPDDLK